MRKAWTGLLIGVTIAALIAAIVVEYLDAGSYIPIDDQPCDLFVDRVTDGNTFRAKTVTRIGARHLAEDTDFRLSRVFAPERGERGYDQAGRDLATMIAGPLRRC